MKTNLSLLLILSLLLAACTVTPEYPAEDEAKDIITEKIEMAAERWSNSDAMGYVEVAAPDISWMDDLAAPVPVMGREALTAYLEPFNGQIPLHTHKLSNMAFQFYGDIVVVTYHYQGILEEGPMPPWKVSSVYRYLEGDWLSVHENWSKVEMPEDSEAAEEGETSE